MAIAIVYDFPDMTRSRYDAIMRDVNLQGKLAPGMVFHAAGEEEEGKWRAVEVWESLEDWQTFFDQKYSAALHKRQKKFSVTPFPVHNFIKWSL